MKTEKKKNGAGKRLLTLVMLLGLIAGMWVPAAAATPFSDVPPGKWYTDAVLYCYEKGYAGGYEDQTFRPDNKLTRAEMAVIMNRMLALKDAGKNTFKDVAAGQWYTEPILRCVKAGVMTGYSDTEFGTADTLTREQGAVILVRAFDVEKSDGRTSFADDAAISKWAAGSVKAMAERGLISGMGENRFGPQIPLTRAQMCQIIYAARQGEEEPDAIRTGDVINIAVSGDGETALQHYFDQQKDAAGESRIDVDGDATEEWIILGERGSGCEQIVTWQDGDLSVLPLNGASLAYSPGENRMLVGEYEDGHYYLSVWVIFEKQWNCVIGGYYSDPEDGPSVDENGYEVFENYTWDGEPVSENEFYTALAQYIDPETMVEV